jgi:hypothetical protein
MVLERDLQTARYTFHIAKQFCKFQKMHEQIMLKKNDIASCIMICLKDQTLQPLDKREALQLVPFLLTDTETINIFTRIRIEDIMLELLKT